MGFEPHVEEPQREVAPRIHSTPGGGEKGEWDKVYKTADKVQRCVKQ